MAFSIRVYFDEEIVALHNLLLGHLAPLDVVLTQVLGFNPIQVTAFKHRAEDELLWLDALLLFLPSDVDW